MAVFLVDSGITQNRDHDRRDQSRACFLVKQYNTKVTNVTVTNFDKTSHSRHSVEGKQRTGVLPAEEMQSA